MEVLVGSVEVSVGSVELPVGSVEVPVGSVEVPACWFCEDSCWFCGGPVGSAEVLLVLWRFLMVLEGRSDPLDSPCLESSSIGSSCIKSEG